MLDRANHKTNNVSRRTFLKSSAAAGLSAVLVAYPRTYAGGSDKIRVGLVGCGGRGRHDTTNLLKADASVEIVAAGDLFRERIGTTVARLSRDFPGRVNVTPETTFTGFDACKKVCQCDVDMVMLIETPHFRPAHFRIAVEAGKHVFMEKPVAVDPVGVRSILQTAEMADAKGLKVVCGTQMRRLAPLVEAVERVHNGQIGDIVAGQCVRIGDALMDWGDKERKPEWSDMEWQIRRWLFVTWLSGDFIVEQHIHNLDIMNWAMNSHPVRCIGVGGRQVRTGPLYGNVYDHMAVEYEYPGGAKIAYMGAQINGCTDRNDQRVQGTKGSAYLDFAVAKITGQNAWTYDGEAPNPEIRQHAEHLAAIRENKPVNEARRVAESTLTAIMGRMAVYTGRELSWDWAMNTSKLDLTPPSYEFGEAPPLEVAVPGKTRLI